MPSCPTCQKEAPEGTSTCPADGTVLYPLIGQSLGDRYRILALLGSGGMGDVYLAEHVLLGRKLAVKVLKEDLCRNEAVVRRFQQEAVAASRIGQENIVSVTDFGRTPDGAFYFVMEALSGQDLRTLLQGQKPLPVERATAILLQVARALIAAHEQGIVHRDLKAENVMVMPRDDGSDLVKVLDFGISKMSSGEAEGSRLTQVGMVIGTPDYMSPEQARGDAVDHRSDIYSFGILAYELITGTVPFYADTLTGVLMKHLSEAPEPPSRRRPGASIPAEYERMVMWALEKDPGRRPQSMTVVRDALLQTARTLGISPRVSGPKPAPEGSAELLEALKSTPPEAFARTYVAMDGVAQGPGAIPLVNGTPALPTARPTRRLARWGAAAAVVIVAGAAGAAGLKWRTWVRRFAPSSMVVSTAVTAQGESPHPAEPHLPAAPPPAGIAPAVPAAPPPAHDAAPPGAAPHGPSEGMTHPTIARPPPVRELTGAQVMPVFKEHMRLLERCVNAHRDILTPSIKRLELSFTVQPSGRVTQAKLITPGVADGPLDACMAGVVRHMRFPRSLTPEAREFVQPLPIFPLH